MLTARLNALRRRLPLRVIRGDFAAADIGSTFDLVVSNPPYVPAPERELPARGPERAWDAGLTGEESSTGSARASLLSCDRAGSCSWFIRACADPSGPSTDCLLWGLTRGSRLRQSCRGGRFYELADPGLSGRAWPSKPTNSKSWWSSAPGNSEDTTRLRSKPGSLYVGPPGERVEGVGLREVPR